MSGSGGHEGFNPKPESRLQALLLATHNPGDHWLPDANLSPGAARAEGIIWGPYLEDQRTYFVGL